MERQLPMRAAWIYFNGLPDDLTDTEFQQFLCGCGLVLPIENISVRNFPNGRGSSAIAAFEVRMVERLVGWAINEQDIRGCSVVPRAMLRDQLPGIPRR